MYQISCVPLIILNISFLALENAWAAPEAHLPASLPHSSWLRWQLSLRRSHTDSMHENMQVETSYISNQILPWMRHFVFLDVGSIELSGCFYSCQCKQLKMVV